MDILCVGYVDSDYASDLDKRKSMTDYIFTFAGGSVGWRLTLYTTVAFVDYRSRIYGCHPGNARSNLDARPIG